MWLVPLLHSGLQLSLGFAKFQIYLTEAGCLLGIHSGFQVSFFQKITPTFVPVFRALLDLETFEGRLGVSFSLDDGDNAT